MVATTQTALTQLLQRPDECEYEFRQSPSARTMTISDAIGRNTSDRSIVSAAVASAAGNLLTFSTDKDDGAGQVVGTIREDFDTTNLNEDIQFNNIVHYVQPFDSCTFPTDAALGAQSGLSYVVKYVNTIEDPLDADKFRDDIKLYDSIGGETTPVAAIVGKTVSFSNKTKVHPSRYNLFYVEQSGVNEGQWVLIPRPTGVAGDHYSVDPVAGTVTLLAPHIAARPVTPLYCYVLKFHRFDRVNEVKKTDLEEIREVIEGSQIARYPTSLTTQEMTASRLVHNNWNATLVVNVPTHTPALDWNYVTAPIVTGTEVLGDYGCDITTIGPGGHLPNDDWPDKYSVDIEARIPILEFNDSRLLSVPPDWTVVSAALRLKVTRISGNREYEFPELTVVSAPGWNPNLSAGRVFRTSPTDNWCANLVWGDDPSADPKCVLRENMRAVLTPDDEGFSGAVGDPAKCDGVIYRKDAVPPISEQEYWFDYTSTSADGWVHNCEFGSPTATSDILGNYPQFGHYGLDGGGQNQRLDQYRTPALYFRDECQEQQTPTVVPHSGNSGSLVCKYKQFFPWSMPEKGAGDSSVAADGTWKEIDVTETIQQVHAEKDTTPGSVGVAVGPLDMIDWSVDALVESDLLLATIMENDRVSESGAPPDEWIVKSFIPEFKNFRFSLEVGELVVTWKTPDGWSPPLAPHRHLPGLSKV